VNSTNESLNEKNGLSEKIVELGGEELIKEIISLEGCRTGEAKITSAYSLPSR
jgi:O-acetyl-ADP-ribose deacetylase (regulator of RNase III)